MLYKKCTVFVNFVNKTPGMLYMVLICMQNCLSLKIGKFFKSWIYPYTPRMLYICYVQLYSQTSKTSNLISLKHQDIIQFH